MILKVMFSLMDLRTEKSPFSLSFIKRILKWHYCLQKIKAIRCHTEYNEASIENHDP